jgi:hypothetical protein
VVSFKETLIIMTSNVGSSRLSNASRGLGFMLETDGSSSQERLRAMVTDELRTYFRPELINRLDEIVVRTSPVKPSPIFESRRTAERIGNDQITTVFGRTGLVWSLRSLLRICPDASRVAMHGPSFSGMFKDRAILGPPAIVSNIDPEIPELDNFATLPVNVSINF